MAVLKIDKNLEILETIVPRTSNCKIAVLVSGGVDSAVALTLLKEMGYEVEAFYLKIWLQDEFVALGDCPWEEDIAYIKPLTDRLNIPLQIIPFQETYWKHIVEGAVSRIQLGETPNPDMLCNSLIKFGAFLRYLRKSFNHSDGIKIASGHYAQLEIEQHSEKGLDIAANSTMRLRTSPDILKDQTYFLARLNQEQLKSCLFPIGHLTKAEVRQYAEIYDLPNKSRKDSQGLCFLGKIRFRDFIRFHLGEKSGSIIERETGKILGKHKGFWYYTIGQRQGLNLSSGPWYVIEKDTQENLIYVSRSEQLGDEDFFIRDLHWISGHPPHHLAREIEGKFQMTCDVKIRHGSERIRCQLRSLETNHYEVHLENKDQGIASGQFAVFYDENICLGSGVIQKKY